ncbi:serine/threonine-protein kinase [Streptomyces yaizuensis]|uniref:non-specific serine/threonine protein kinase n=1 Tax=Streptomyces yaizuensis TaxID=2989713 RepID=A0ABQ5NUJ6_9ACTN|nr:protein kinase [Streptomyces sp. YSPA8]GLF94046.1 protein kinase [Streptomyces sp. YSPA8]
MERLGAGGMGEVWSAQDERMRRDVAVKLVDALPRTSEAGTKARFQREVQSAGRFAHRNIVTVHDWGEVPVNGRQTLYLVMELVPGTSLHHRLKTSVPAWPLTVGWAAQITQALHTAHGHGVVHRDIKPANVLLTPEGTVKVLDFGIAKFVGDTLSSHDLTATGALLGSPPYMSPEQAEGVREIDHRSDLYSLGCLLYHAVTGRPPFTGTSMLAVLRMQVQETPVEPSALAEGIPGALNDLIMGLLAKRPEDRPADAAAVHDVLTTLLIDHAAALSGGDVLNVVHLGHEDSLAGRILRKSWQVWRDTEEHGAARRQAADAHFEETRAKAARAAADFETNLAKRREQTARDLAAREAKAMQRLAEVEHRCEELRLEAVKLRNDAERDARRTVEAARRQAEQIVAADAKAAPPRAEAGHQRTVGMDRATGDRSSPFGFELVRRGYDRGQVDQYITLLVSDRDAALVLIDRLERLTQELQLASPDVAQNDDRYADARHQVEDIIAEVNNRVERADRSRADRFGFELVRRGYDREQVDEYLAKLVADRDSALANIARLAQRIKEWSAPPA